MTNIVNNKWFHITIALIIGAIIGVVFYPSKRIEEELTHKHQLELEKISTENKIIVKNINNQLDKIINEYSSYKQQVNNKYESYESKIKELQSTTKESTYKLVKPDGTIIEKTFKESEIIESENYVKSIRYEFDSKVESIENKWMTIHQEKITAIKEEYTKKTEEKKKELEYLYTKRVESINQSRYHTSLGYDTDNRFYISGGVIIIGPIFIDMHIESDKELNKAAGLGIGVRF